MCDLGVEHLQNKNGIKMMICDVLARGSDNEIILCH